MDSKMTSKQSLDTPTTKTPHDIESGSVEECRDTSQNGLRAWAKNLSIETSGIQRVTDAERQQSPTKVWNACTFWYVSQASARDSF